MFFKPLRPLVPLSLVLAGVVGLVACGGGSATGAGMTARARAAGADWVAVSPAPGTPDASPATQVSFLGPSGTTVEHITVLGSRSGSHSGVLRRYSTGTGESFLPTRGFAAGEQVSVTAQVSAGGSTQTVRTRFTVAHQVAVSQKQFPLNPGNASEVQHYSTAASLTPSSVRITTAQRSGSAPGYLFLAPYQGAGSAGPMIAEQDGGLVWFHPLPAGISATNFHVQSYEGHPVLTWWQGRILEVGFGQGEDEIYNTAYQHLATVRAGNGYHADLHEIRLTPEGTAWIDVFDPIEMNLSREHGLADGVLTDSVIEEIDIKTGLVMWEWHALAHIPPTDSHNAPSRSQWPWDYVHINSVDPRGEEVLLSSRNTWTIYDVSLRTGGVLWRLGGDHSSFAMGPGTHFYWQHDAEWQAGGLISVFDNGADPAEEKQSRGLLLKPEPGSHRVTLIRQFTNPSRTLLATSQGNVLSLPGGDWLLGYGGLPNFTEFGPSGQVLLDGTLGKNVQDFRTYLGQWSGQAPGAPSLLVKAAGSSLQASVSWNGATEVSSWRVLAGPSAGSLRPVATAARSGFQTTISVPSPGPAVQVQALNASGAVIGASAVSSG